MFNLLIEHMFYFSTPKAKEYCKNSIRITTNQRKKQVNIAHLFDNILVFRNLISSEICKKLKS